MVINEVKVCVRKEVTRKGKRAMKWVPMLKGVGYLFRYRDVSLAANGRYLRRSRSRIPQTFPAAPDITGRMPSPWRRPLPTRA